MKSLHTTLLIILKDKKILLARKKRGFGTGNYNGVGGKLEPGETIEQAMIRETIEEVGVVPKNYQDMGQIQFDEVMKGEKLLNIMHIFVATDFEGEPVESDEMEPKWFDADKIPYENMFIDDRYWLPEILKGNRVDGNFVYDEKYNLLSKQLKIIKK